MPTPKKHILCVDDHADTCAFVTTILRDYETISAYSMADAIKQATPQKFDLYILDYHLPDETGLELCLMLRGFDRDTPILFATASSSILLNPDIPLASARSARNPISLRIQNPAPRATSEKGHARRREARRPRSHPPLPPAANVQVLT